MTTAPTQAQPVVASQPNRIFAFVRRYPFTTSLVGVLFLVAIASGGLWRSVQDRDLYSNIGYGLPAFQDGKWWTVFTGPLFARTPAQYLLMIATAALFVGIAERVLGTQRAAIAAIAGQIVAILGAAGILLLLSNYTDWGWAARLKDDIDVGFVSGSFCALAAASAAMRPPWRGRLRLVLVLYAGITFLYIGVLWDLQHLIGTLLGLAIGPYLLGRSPRIGRPRIHRDEWRRFAFALFVIAAFIRVLLWFVPADGPLGAASEDDSIVGVLISAGVSLLLAYFLLKGKRVAWRWAVAFSGTVVVLLAIALPLAIIDPENTEVDFGEVGVPATVVDISLWVIQLGVLLVGERAFRSPSKRKLRKMGSLMGDERTTAVALLQRDGGTSLSWMTTWDGNHWYVPPTPDGTPHGYVAYQLHQGAAVALGDPIAPNQSARLALLESYVDYWDKQGRVPCFFSATQETADWAAAKGWQYVQVADEAVIDLPDLEFKGKAWQDIRTALNRAGKEGVEYRSGRLAEMPRGVIQQVRAISQDWVGDKSLPEMGFTLGTVEEALDPNVVVGLAVDTDGTIHGVTSWLPVYSPGGEVNAWTLDVMRRLPDGFRPTTEFLIASACLEFQQQGCAYVSLSGAPLAHSGDEDTSGALDQLLAWLGNTLEPVYGFRSLESFKQKFKPRHNPLYLVFKDEANLPRIGLAITRAYVPDASLRELAATGIKARRDA